MQETLTDIRNRRSCRKYLTQQIKEEELNAVLEAATWTPTGKGLQTPQLVVVQDAATAIALCDALAMHLGTDWLK